MLLLPSSDGVASETSDRYIVGQKWPLPHVDAIERVTSLFQNVKRANYYSNMNNINGS